jgi:hypothetical protein
MNPTELLNGKNIHGGSFTTDQTGGVVNSGNTAFGATGGSPAALRGGNLYSIGNANNSTGSPSSIQTPLSSSSGMMKGGGRRRKYSRKHIHSRSRSRSSKKYARKHSLKYRIKHRHSRRHSHSRAHSKKFKAVRRSQAGGYHQYMGNTPFTLGYRTPGFNLTSNTSSLATPTPFMPYRNN